VIRGVRSWRLYGWLIVILLGIVVLAPGLGHPSKAIGAAHDFAHAPIFGIVCVALLLLLRDWPASGGLLVRWQYGIAFVMASGLGLATEIAQGFTGRDPSWLDLRSDIVGAAAAASIFAVFDRRVSRGLAKGACILGLTTFAMHSIPMIAVAFDYWRRAREFPVLVAGESVGRNGFLSAIDAHIEQRPLPASFAHVPGEGGLYALFGEGSWPSIYLSEPSPDWSDFEVLALDVTNPCDAELQLTVRVHDRQHNYRHDDRFNRVFMLAPRERTTLRIPLADIERAPRGRSLDLRQVAGLILFTTGAYAGGELYLSRIWLEHDH
jgi:hypothetical protein